MYFNIQIHIELMSHYDMYQIILYNMHINYVTFISHIVITFMVYVYLFVIYCMCINIFISRSRTSENRTEREYINADISR